MECTIDAAQIAAAMMQNSVLIAEMIAAQKQQAFDRDEVLSSLKKEWVSLSRQIQEEAHSEKRPIKGW